MRKVVDLHVHTNHSDSTATPVEVVDLAHKKGFKAIGITDHDCIDGIKPSIERAMKYDLEIVPGIEMAAEFDNFEMHILGYFIDWKSDSFIKKLEKIRLSRVERIFQMCKKLKNKGIDIDPKRVLELSGPGAVGRLHLAIAIYNEGYISTVGEAFRKYIGNNASCYVKKFKLTPKEVISMILDLGGVPVLAHPHILGRDELIPKLVSFGLRGLEVYHTAHPTLVTLKYEEIALKHRLIATGGSDCHGMGKGGILLGKIKLPYSIVEDLKEESRRINISRISG